MKDMYAIKKIPPLGDIIFDVLIERYKIIVAIKNPQVELRFFEKMQRYQ